MVLFPVTLSDLNYTKLPHLRHFGRLLGYLEIKGTSHWNSVQNSGLRKFRNCTSTVAGVVKTGGRSVCVGRQFITLSVMPHVERACLR